MANSTEVLIGDADGHHVLLRPLSRCHPGLFDYRDGNWIECELQISVGGFRGAFRADLRSEEFQAFLAQLEALSRTRDSAAVFSTMEGQIALSLTGEGENDVRVRGEAVDAAGIGNRLQFEFEIDPACLSAICQSVQYLLAAFPVTGTPDT